MTGHDQMRVIRQNGAGEDVIPRFVGSIMKSAGDQARLMTVETDGLIFERIPGGQSFSPVVRHISDGMSRGDFCGRPETQEIPLADEIGPRAARIVGKPESVGGKDQVIRMHHDGGEFSRDKSLR